MVIRRNAEGETETLVCPKCDKAIERDERWYGRGWCGGPEGEIVEFVWKKRLDSG